MGKNNGWSDIQKGFETFMGGLSSAMREMADKITESPHAKGMQDIIKSGKMKIDDAINYIGDLKTTAEIGQFSVDDVSLWQVLEDIVQKDFASYDDAFFEQMAQMKGNPQAAKIGQDILAERRKKRPNIVFDKEVTGVFNKFTDRSKRVLTLAEQAARKMGHNFIAAPHLMIGLINEGSGVGASTMHALMGKNFDKGFANLNEQTKINMSDIEDPKPDAPVRLTKRAREVILNADKEAIALKHGRIGTEHILLALTLQFPNNGPLQAMGVKAEDIRAAVLQLFNGEEKPAKLTTDDLNAMVTEYARATKTFREFGGERWDVVVGNEVVLSYSDSCAQVSAESKVEALRFEMIKVLTKHLKAKGLL
jgi:hypothetical protein